MVPPSDGPRFSKNRASAGTPPKVRRAGELWRDSRSGPGGAGHGDPWLDPASFRGYPIAMKSVNAAELKNRLSHYLRLVRRGEPILVRDRDQVIARIEPAGDALATGTDTERLAVLERKCAIRRVRGRIDAELLAQRPRVRADLVAALLREREEGR
jgi:antitoxin (DNA-binding transcriptional repressor) of toxin-antitoxin stability system